MTSKTCFILVVACVIALGFSNDILSQPAEKYYLRLTPFTSQKDSLSLEIERRFWQEFREHVEKSETVKIISGWDEIVDLLEYAEEITRTPAIFDTSKIQNPAMISPNLHVRGTIRILRQQEAELDIQIVKIRTSEEIATEHARIPISTDPFKDNSTPVIRRLILKLMERLDPQIKKQKEWLGEPFDPEKINILVADFTNYEGNVDAPGKQWAFKTFNELDRFMKADPALQEVAEVKQLYSDSTGIVIREETHAKEVGEEMNADMIIWGQNLCSHDSVCYYAKAFINHEARMTSIIQEGVMHQTQLLRADLPMLIGANANAMIKIIIGWTYLKDYRHQQFQQALKYLKQALAEISAEERHSVLLWAGVAGGNAGEYELALTWYAELEKEQIISGNRIDLANTYNNIGFIYARKKEWDKSLEFYLKSETICNAVGKCTSLAIIYNNIGGIYSNKGEWNKALEFYYKSEPLFKHVGNRVGLAIAYDNIGDIYRKKGEWNKALEFCQKSETILKEVKDQASLAFTYGNIGNIYNQKGEWENALTFYLKAKTIFEKIGGRVDLAHTYNNLGLIYAKKGERNKALELYRKAETAFGEIGDSASLATTYNNIGGIYFDNGEWDKTLEFYNKAEAISNKIGDRTGLAATYNNIGEFYRKKGDRNKALEFYRKAEAVTIAVGDRTNLFTIYNNIGLIYSKKGEWENALKFSEKAVVICREIGNHAGLVSIYNNIGKVYDNKGERDKALEVYHIAETIAVEVGDHTGLTITYSNIGLIYYKKGDQDKALEFYYKAEAIGSRNGDQIGLIPIYNSIGKIYADKGASEKALEFYYKAEAIGNKTGNSNGLARTYNFIGEIYDDKGQWDIALKFYYMAEAISSKSWDHVDLAPIYNNIAKIYNIKGEWDKALGFCQRAEVLLKDAVDSVSLATTYSNMATIYRGKKDFEKAIQFGQKSLKITLQTGDLINENMAHFNLAKTFFAQTRYQEAVPHLERCVEIDRQLNHPQLKTDLQSLLMAQFRAHVASGIRYEMLDQFWASSNDLQKGDLFRQINDWQRATAYYRSHLRETHDSLSLAEQAQIQNFIGVGYIKQSKGDSALPYSQAALQGFQKVNDQNMVGTVYNNLGVAQMVRQAWPEALEWLRKSAAHNRAVAGDSASVLGFTYCHLAEVFLHTQQPDSARYYVEKSLLLRQALGEAENVKQTQELRERILSAGASSVKK